MATYKQKTDIPDPKVQNIRFMLIFITMEKIPKNSYYSSTKTLNTIVIAYQWGRGPMVMFTIIPAVLLYPVSSLF